MDTVLQAVLSDPDATTLSAFAADGGIAALLDMVAHGRCVNFAIYTWRLIFDSLRAKRR